ncbi:MAG: glutamate--tRNA ligase [Clostridia bacterium]|nr:glutamate--tRNA ligase [Clostridia bacterium]
MDYKKLANLLFPMELKTPEYYEDLYKQRVLKEGAIVTRFAPSPTGFLHFGGLYTSFFANRIAKQSEGKYILRIEDTDQKREVANGVRDIITGLFAFGIVFDETPGNVEYVDAKYGPYKQSERKDIYMTFAKKLVQEGKAYPCFCSSEQLSADRKAQEKAKTLLGYYGHYARCKNLSYEDIETKVNNGEKFAIRLKVDSSPNNKIIVNDAIRGELRLSDNYNDVVILKSDFLPPYNFAHACDDHLMRVNLVVRGDEYLPSIAEHLQIFEALNFEPIKYAHVAPIQKIDENGNKRKISKRKDPEAAVSFYNEQGYPAESVQEYILTVANSNFEAWRKNNEFLPVEKFIVSFDKMSISGALFDFAKLADVSKTVISKMSAKEVYDRLVNWTSNYDKELDMLLRKYKDYSIQILNIEREQKKPRKDIEKWSDIKVLNSYFYDELFNPTKKEDYEFNYDNFNLADVQNIMESYLKSYSEQDDKQTWFNKIKVLSSSVGYSDDMKAYKATPEGFKGHYGDVAGIIRVVLTSRTQTPDLYEISRLLGKERMEKRVELAVKVLK